MNKLSLLLLLSAALFNANGQVGSLDPAFGNKGIKTTAFLDNSNTLSEEGRVVLVDSHGHIFVVARLTGNASYTRIVKYLPDGRRDASYGNGGYSTGTNLSGTSAVMQGDKIIVAGSIPNLGIPDEIGLVRYNPDGTLDVSFGENGIVKTKFSNYQANAIILQGDEIIVGGYDDNYQFFLARFAANGSLDSSFGANGSATTDFNSSGSFVRAVILQGDKIVAAGGAFNAGTYNYDFAVARFTADGTLDSSFGENGKATTEFDNSDAQATSIALQEDKILVAGFGDATVDFVLTRYTADGKLDSSFAENGKVTTNFNNSFYNYAYSMTLQGDNILLAGETLGDFALARYTADGVLDTTFGANGIVITDFNHDQDHGYSIALQGEKIILLGSTFDYFVNGFPADFAVIRYTADGSMDSSFGENGIIAGHFPKTQVYFTSTVAQGDKVIAAGYDGVSYPVNAFALSRYNADGSLDSSFGVKGKVKTNFDNSDQKANSVVLQGDKIIVGGYTGNVFSYHFMLARYTADGKLDSSFGVNGRVITDFTNGYDEMSAIAMQGDKILVTGYVYGANLTDFSIARYTANGKLDPTFGVNGKVTTDFFHSYDLANLIAVQGDKIITAGSTGLGSSDFAIARYTANGVLDPSFGSDGKVVTTITSYSDDHATAIAMDGNKIILAGNSVDLYQNSSFVLVRYTADGMLDASFGENGIVTTDFVPSYGHANSIAAQDEKVIVGGNIGNSDFSFARYTADGSLDPFFGENGKVTTNLGGPSALGQIAVQENRFFAVGSLTFAEDESYGVVAAYKLETPGPGITISDITVLEWQRLASATVRLSAPTDRMVWMHYSTRDKTAIQSKDYVGIESRLLFMPGSTKAKIFIPIIDDKKAEGTETFEIVLSDAHHATIRDSIGVVTILDDDVSPIVTQEPLLYINASPNPSVSGITLQIQGGTDKQPVGVRVYDVSGRLIEERKNISIGERVRLGDQYKKGTYIIEAVQGSESVQTKVIKSSN